MITFKIAYREIKNNFKYWILFILNLAIGLLGFTFILLFRDNINYALELRSKNILSSDLAITGRRELEKDEKEEVSHYLESKFLKKTKVVEIYSMGKTIKNKKSRLVFVKAIEQEFPLIGEIVLKNLGKLTPDVFREFERLPYLIITEEVSHQFKIQKGDQLKIGELLLTVLDIVISDSTTSMRGMSLAPKVYIPKKYLKETQLIKFGSVAWYTDFYLFKEKNNIEEIQKDLQTIIKDPAIGVRVPKDAGEQIGRILNYLSDYLGLIGVVALMISSIGSTYLFQNYIFRRLNQIGILKSLGLSSNRIILSFSWVVIIFGFISSLFALILAQNLLPLALSYVSKWVVIDSDQVFSAQVIFSVLAIGLGLNLIICIPVLKKLFHHKTTELLSEVITPKIMLVDLIYYLPSLLFVWGISVWQAHSFKIGSFFTGALFLIFTFVLILLPRFFRLLNHYLKDKLISWPLSLGFGYGTRLFVRNRLSSILTILSLSVGVSLLVLIGQIDTSLKSELTDQKTPRPSLFLFDIQDEQLKPLLALGQKENIPFVAISPMIRGKLIKKNGKEIKRELLSSGFSTREEENQKRFNNRGVNLTYAQTLNSSEKIVSGREFYGKYSGEGNVEISLEKRYAKRIGVEVGDTLTYEILGVELKCEVVNLRSVKWTSFLPNFFIVVQSGVLEDAPKTFLMAVQNLSQERRLEVQDLIVENFSNISLLNVSDVISKILGLFQAMAWAINLMGLCCIIVGLFVLFSILQGQLIQKEKEFALQKIMGMHSKQIFQTIIFEYSQMILLSIFFGNVIGTALAYLVSLAFLDGVFVFNWIFTMSFNVFLILSALTVIYLTFKTKYHKKINHLLYA